MKTTMNITISHVLNANELDKFEPVSGAWMIHECDPDDRTTDAVAESVRNFMDADYPISVQVFTADGKAITGDIPDCGQFIATRELR